MQFISPTTAEHWQAYYQLRYEVLRAPWQQPLGSEQDASDVDAFHVMAWHQQQALAVGRVHLIDSDTAQVRYMAVAPAAQGQYLAMHILAELEQYALKQGASSMMLHARDTALGFYQQAGYEVVKPSHLLFGEIQHYEMRKSLTQKQWLVAKQDVTELADTWADTIPLSQAMQLSIRRYSGVEFATEAPLPPNINLHGTMFAGSIYTMATLTGWGAIQLLQQRHKVPGSLVLADGQIKYLKPVTQNPNARCMLPSIEGDFSPLEQGKNAKFLVPVTVYSGDEAVAQFSGKFAVLASR